MKLMDKDMIRLRNYCQVIISQPRALDAQPSVREGVHLWCEDWELIEILKFMFLGKETYLIEPPPNRLKNNPLWSKENIIKMAEKYMEIYQDADQIVSLMKGIRNGKHD